MALDYSLSERECIDDMREGFLWSVSLRCLVVFRYCRRQLIAAIASLITDKVWRGDFLCSLGGGNDSLPLRNKASPVWFV